MQIVIGIIFIAAFVTWFLIDRHFFIKRTVAIYDKLMDDMHGEYKKAFDDISERANNVEESRWDIMLVEACGHDQEKLRSKFQPGWSMATLNTELEVAAKDYADAFKQQAPLQSKVARIINLLYLFIISRNEEDATKLAQLRKLRLKDLN